MFPAKFNTANKNKTVEGAISQFEKMHNESDKEHLIQIDSQGFAQKYRIGDESSVTPSTNMRYNSHAVHNHPVGGYENFSVADLYTTSTQKAFSGITATSTRNKVVGRRGRGKGHEITRREDKRFTFEKGTHFKAREFERAISKATFRGLDYNHAVDNWLTANQKKYGYKYTSKGYTNPSRSAGAIKRTKRYEDIPF